MEGPTSHIYFSQRLRLHYVDWGNEGAPPMLLVHGGRDHCRNWDWVAQAFRDDYHIIAPDLRGHGDSQWLLGGSYDHVDYVYDIAQLLHQRQHTPVTIISHSLGGSISLLYAGLYPETVTRLVSIEGMGPPPSIVEERINQPPAARLTSWIDDLRRIAGRIPRRYKSLEEAYERMQTENPHLTEAQARHLTIHGSNQNEDGTYSWKFDNYVRAFPPVGMPYEEQQQLHRRISCPTLLFHGQESWASNPEEDGRIDNFQNAQVASVANAGHWVHHDQLDEFLSITRAFLAG
ncbi:MAG: alpha/beta hydrolase [Gammaproteobacteria bacterium]|nr:alpha/beta hydrolase [Gammaproteobacteria bacterium]MDD9962319.1 alpha/beta hydrolase [Gammaproteobacteria bacterium]MDE0271690.1 alpha/beta hydrolase [Gammaproteobacteria bacterium]